MHVRLGDDQVLENKRKRLYTAFAESVQAVVEEAATGRAIPQMYSIVTSYLLIAMPEVVQVISEIHPDYSFDRIFDVLQGVFTGVGSQYRDMIISF